MNDFHGFRRRALYALLASAMPVASVQAAWEILPQVETQVLTNDNVRMYSDESGLAEDTTRMRVDARVRFSNFNERGNIYIEPRIRAESYAESGNDDLEGGDRFFRTSAVYNWPNMQLGFRTDFDVQDVRSAELTNAAPDDPDVDDPIDPDTGTRFFIFDEDRERLTVSPFVVIGASERTDLVFRLNYMDVTYTEAAITGRSPFEDLRFTGGISRRVDERNRVSANFIASNYESMRNTNTTDSAGVEGNFNRIFPAGWTMNLNFGVLRSDYSFVDQNDEVQDNAETNVQVNLGFRQRTERNTLNVNLSRQVIPNGSGFVSVRNELRVYLDRILNARLSAGVGVRVYETTTVGDALRDDDRDYARLELGLEWALTERTFLTIGYDITDQEYKSVRRPGESSSNEFWVGFNYRGLGI